MTTEVASGDQVVALAGTIDEDPTLIGRQVTGHATLPAGERIVRRTGKSLAGPAALATGETLIGTTTGDRLTGGVTVTGKALVRTTPLYSALMFGRSVMAGKVLVGMTVARERLIWTGARHRDDPCLERLCHD